MLFYNLSENEHVLVPMRSIISHIYGLLFCSSNRIVRTGTWISICLILFYCVVSQVLLCSCSKRFAEPEEEELDIYSIEGLLKKPRLKVLDIGNSYSEGALALLPTVVKSCEAEVNDMCLYSLFRGGASFRSWCDVYEDIDTLSYSFSRVIGDLSVSIPSGSCNAGDGSLFRRALSEVEWDFIIIHQVSTYAPYYESWKGDDVGGCLEQLLEIIHKHQPNTKIGFLLVHSYWDDYIGNRERSSLERWQKIADSIQFLKEDYNIQFIIPYGTAIENLRSSSMNNNYDLTSDGSHLECGLGQYTAACCYYESLITPRTGISCYGSNVQIDVSDVESRYPAVNVTMENSKIAQKAAVLAVKDMFHCNNPELIALE